MEEKISRSRLESKMLCSGLNEPKANHSVALMNVKKLNWTCTSCGMSSGRKFSVQRHIQNYNVHNGQGLVIPFVEYAIGRGEGKYLTQELHNSRSQSFSLDRIFDKITEKLENEIAEQIAKAICQNILADQDLFNNLKMVANSKIIKKNYYKYLKELTS